MVLGIRWGCEHEAKARQDYEQSQKDNHKDLEVTEYGFFIHKDLNDNGASPDGLVSCHCCGLGVIEVKCLFCQKEKAILDAPCNKNICLKKIIG